MVAELPRSVQEAALSLLLSPLLLAAPRGHGAPVLVLPGLLTGDVQTSALRAVLRWLGHDSHGWQLGLNVGPQLRVERRLAARVETLAEESGQPVAVVGWSLGGIYARVLARRHPEHVGQVITLGSPFRLARHSQSRATRVFERFSHLHIEHRTLPLERDAGPLPVPSTSIYSHLDGIVAWQACLDTPTARCENIAVLASHLGLGHHPAAIWAIADRLAQPEGTWQPFRAPLFRRPAFPRPDGPGPESPADAHGSAA